MKYRVEVPGRFHDCGEESVVYFDLQSGDTHLVSDFAAHIIALLADRTMDIQELVTAVAPDIEADDLPALTEALPDILAELISLESVEQG